MIPEAAYAMLACARIGAMHSVVFGGFSPDSLAGRIADCKSKLVDHRRRGRARRQDDPAQAEHRRGARRKSRGDEKVLVVAPHRRPMRHGTPAATSGYDEMAAKVAPTARRWR